MGWASQASKGRGLNLVMVQAHIAETVSPIFVQLYLKSSWKRVTICNHEQHDRWNVREKEGAQNFGEKLAKAANWNIGLVPKGKWQRIWVDKYLITSETTILLLSEFFFLWAKWMRLPKNKCLVRKNSSSIKLYFPESKIWITKVCKHKRGHCQSHLGACL